VFSGAEDQEENGIEMTAINAARRAVHEEKTGWLIGKRVMRGHSRAEASEPDSERVFATELIHPHSGIYHGLLWHKLPDKLLLVIPRFQIFFFNRILYGIANYM